jgi:palmitoyltransferase
LVILWQIGNCVGADNHRSFIAFLISGLFSTIYISIVSAHAGLHVWPPLTYSIGRIHGATSENLAWRIVKETIFAFLRSVLLLSTRGFILVYLFIASVSMMIGLSALLWQQLRFIYEGETYLSRLSSQAHNGAGKKDCQNLVRFFGFPYSVQRFLPKFLATQKRHIKGNTHDL